MTPVLPPGPLSTYRRMRELAGVEPDRTAVSARGADGGWSSLTRAELVALAEAQAARLLAEPPGPYTVVALPNGIGFFVAVLASWWAGRTPLVVPPESTAPELVRLFSSVGRPREEIFAFDGSELVAPVRDASAPTTAGRTAATVAVGAAEPAVAWYLPSGGSTSLPRLVPVPGRPADQLSGQSTLLGAVGWRPDADHLVLGPLSHAAPFTCALTGLVHGNHVVLVDRFAPGAVRDAVRRVPPTWCQLTPHQMAVIGADPAFLRSFGARLAGLLHTAAPCPAAVKRLWMDSIGADRVYELYASTQMVGAVVSRGTDWLQRPGTVGRPYMTQVRILDEKGLVLPPGQVGEVYLRTAGTRRLSAAQTGHLRGRPGGYFSVGDLGYLDEDGFLFLVDRVDDVIIVGGANVSAREVEQTLVAHPAVGEALVVGRPDRLLGQRVHALVVPADAESVPDTTDLRAHCAGLLAPHKVPTSIEVIAEFERSHAGKIQRFRYR
ncbi:class I adenylate-forming enzyme family protein [Micromonospora sp. NPDC050397]|uniref:class I adenylate-forming enzyme family protein n=1 Tax=Micromonospora sp. NPDC050397 TaxID=3364279 RepID=UPI00384D27BB